MGIPRTQTEQTLTRLQRFLLATLMVGVAGMGTELLFIGHTEGAQQMIPLTLLAGGFIALLWHATQPGVMSVWVVRVLMALFVVSGMLGVGLHYQGNAAFELEMYPEMAGSELIWNTLTGATPVLAPGSMVLLGLVGFATVYGATPKRAVGAIVVNEERTS